MLDISKFLDECVEIVRYRAIAKTFPEEFEDITGYQLDDFLEKSTKVDIINNLSKNQKKKFEFLKKKYAILEA